MKKAKNQSFLIANFSRIQLLAKIVDQESPGSEFAQSAFLSFRFAFRVPSETLELRRSYSDDDMSAFSPQREKAVIGVRLDGGEPFRAAKLS